MDEYASTVARYRSQNVLGIHVKNDNNNTINYYKYHKGKMQCFWRCKRCSTVVSNLHSTQNMTASSLLVSSPLYPPGDKGQRATSRAWFDVLTSARTPQKSVWILVQNVQVLTVWRHRVAWGGACSKLVLYNYWVEEYPYHLHSRYILCSLCRVVVIL